MQQIALETSEYLILERKISYDLCLPYENNKV
jgi:hypothetical protein